MMFTPSKGYRELSAIRDQPAFTPSGFHANTFWAGGSLPQPQQQVLQAQPWKQQGFAQGVPAGQQLSAGLFGQQLLQPMVPVPGLGGAGYAGVVNAQQQQQLQQQQQQQSEASELERLRRENAMLQFQLQQSAAAATPGWLNPGVDPTLPLLQPLLQAC
jgi:hypothetical protein